METVTIDGMQYIKAGVLARKYKYTADYLGQLCRGKKVDAHLVGRTWYVNQKSLDSHKDTRYLELRSNEKTFKVKTTTMESRLAVPASLSNAAVKAQRNFENRLSRKSPRYESDDTNLLPDLSRSLGRRVVVDMADSEQLTVQGLGQNATLKAVPLPAVSLSGTLKVQNYESRIDLDVGRDNVKNMAVVEPVELSGEHVSGDFAGESSLYDREGEEARIIHPTKVSGASLKVRLHKAKEGAVTTQIETSLRSSQIRMSPLPAINNRLTKSGVPQRGGSPLQVMAAPPLSTLTHLGANHASISLLRLVAVPVVVLVFGVITFTLLATETVVTSGPAGETSSSLRYSAAVFYSLKAFVF